VNTTRSLLKTAIPSLYCPYLRTHPTLIQTLERAEAVLAKIHLHCRIHSVEGCIFTLSVAPRFMPTQHQHQQQRPPEFAAMTRADEKTLAEMLEVETILDKLPAHSTELQDSLTALWNSTFSPQAILDSEPWATSEFIRKFHHSIGLTFIFHVEYALHEGTYLPGSRCEETPVDEWLVKDTASTVQSMLANLTVEWHGGD
jgi:hypothetical protein